MKRIIILSTALLGAMSSAHADHYLMNYRDLIRPHGHARSDAVYQANLDLCYGRTGADRASPDNAAFKACMRTRGYRFLSTRLVPDAVDPAQADADAASSAQDIENQQARDDAFRAEQSAQDAVNTQNMINNQDMINAQQQLNNPPVPSQQ